MSSAEFAEISWWFGYSDSASARKSSFPRQTRRGARFVASSWIENIFEFRFGNRFFIALIFSHFSSSQDKLLPCREMCNQKQNCKQEEFLIFYLFQFAIFEKFCGRGWSGRFQWKFPSRKNDSGGSSVSASFPRKTSLLPTISRKRLQTQLGISKFYIFSPEIQNTKVILHSDPLRSLSLARFLRTDFLFELFFRADICFSAVFTFIIKGAHLAYIFL